MTAVHRLDATPDTVHWGFFDPHLPPSLTVASGDLVAIQTLTHHAGDAPDLLTGPIAVAGARPGDVLQVDILEATPRLPYGSNLAGHWDDGAGGRRARGDRLGRLARGRLGVGVSPRRSV